MSWNSNEGIVRQANNIRIFFVVRVMLQIAKFPNQVEKKLELITRPVVIAWSDD